MREHYRRTGRYAYLSGGAASYVVLNEPPVLNALRFESVRQAQATLDPRGGLTRLGPDAVEQTRALWRSRA